MSIFLAARTCTCKLKYLDMLKFAVGMFLYISHTTHAAVAPAPTPGKTSRASAGGFERVINDMHLPSEALVIDPRFEWQHRPQITTHAPRGDAIAAWWKGDRPAFTHAVIAWFTAFEGHGNLARNSRVQVKNLRIFVLSNRTRKWRKIDQRLQPYISLWKYPFSSAGPACGVALRVERKAGMSVAPRYPYFLHGWGKLQSIDASDVGAIFVAMEFRLTMQDPRKKDDRKVARYVVDVGADYYPDKASRWSLGYAPGVGNGRMLLARSQWRTATFLAPNTDYGITFKNLGRNPPPLFASESKDVEESEYDCGARSTPPHEK